MTIATRRFHAVLLLATLALPIACSDASTGDDGSGKTTTVAWGQECAATYYGRFTYDVSTPEQSCVDLVNQYRALQDVPTLARWIDGEACVATQAADDAAVNTQLSSFGDCGELAQSVYSGAPSIDVFLGTVLLGMYCAGPSRSEHANLVNTSYTMVACGFYQTSGGGYWVNINFK